MAKEVIEAKAQQLIENDLKDYIETTDDESYKSGLELLQKQVDKNRSTTDKVQFLDSIISGLEYHKSEHQKICPERKKNSFCQWEENYDEVIFYANKEKKRLILSQELLSFEEKIVSIFKELATRLGRQADLREILTTCDITYIENDLPEFRKFFDKTGYVNTSRITKDGYYITLNQTGLDYLKQMSKNESTTITTGNHSISKKVKDQGDNIEHSNLEIEHPIVFISYSWDDEEHKEWVLKVANRLRTDGVDVILDRYHLRPGVNLSFFVENSLRTSNRVITILTPQYKSKADNRKGGVGQEYTIINNELIKNIATNERIIPVLRKGNPDSSIPDFLKTYIYVSFINDDDFDKNYEELVREIYKSPKITPPELGSRPSFISNKISTLIEQILPPIETPEIINPIQEIKKISHSLTKGSYEERKNKVLKIYQIALNVPLGEVLDLVNDKNLDVNIAAAISLKSVTENLNIDLGTNPNVRQFIVSNLNHKSSFLRYRIFDYISVSETLQKDFKTEIKKQLTNENNEEVSSKINSILGVKPVKPETNKQRIKTELQSLLMENRVNDVLKALIEHTQNGREDIRNSIIMLAAQFAQLEKETRMGLISFSDVNIQRNRLMNGLISLVNEL